MKINSDGTARSGRKLGLPGMDMGDSTPWLNAHGLMMWGSWTILGMVQIITNRYMKHHFKYRQLIHGISGFCMLLLTLLSYIIVFKMNDWHIVFNYAHAIVANPTVFVGIVVFIGGALAKMRRDKELPWQTDKILQMVKIHRGFGYFIIFFSQVTMSLGINCKWIDGGMMGMVYGVALANLALFFTVLFTFEIFH